MCYCGNSSEEKVGVEEKTVKEGLGEGAVEKSRANWCTPPTNEGVEPSWFKLLQFLTNECKHF